MADDERPDPGDEAPKPKATRRDKAALPFAEDAEQLDGRAWNRKPLLVLAALVAVVIVVVVLFLALRDLSGDDGGGGGGDVPPPVSSTTTTAPTTTSTSTTTSTTAPPPTTGPTGPVPGTPCSPEEGSPDCIDPEGDGSSTIITGGADCLEQAEDPLECADNDGDGDAGPSVIPT